jgi:hypothetical protein
MAIDPKSKEMGLPSICMTLAFSPFIISPRERAKSIAALWLTAFTNTGQSLSPVSRVTTTRNIATLLIPVAHLSLSNLVYGGEARLSNSPDGLARDTDFG